MEWKYKVAGKQCRSVSNLEARPLVSKRSLIVCKLMKKWRYLSLHLIEFNLFILLQGCKKKLILSPFVLQTKNNSFIA